jgi:hypothetical protein
VKRNDVILKKEVISEGWMERIFHSIWKLEFPVDLLMSQLMKDIEL